jgi:hypothetical protein
MYVVVRILLCTLHRTKGTREAVRMNCTRHFHSVPSQAIPRPTSSRKALAATHYKQQTFYSPHHRSHAITHHLVAMCKGQDLHPEVSRECAGSTEAIRNFAVATALVGQ